MQTFAGVNQSPAVIFAGGAYQDVEAAGQPIDGVSNADAQRSHIDNHQLVAINGVNLIQLVSNETAVDTLFILNAIYIIVVVDSILGDSQVDTTLKVSGADCELTVMQFIIGVLVGRNVDMIEVNGVQHYVLFISCESGCEASNCHQSYKSKSKNFLCVHEYSP